MMRRTLLTLALLLLSVIGAHSPMMQAAEPGTPAEAAVALLQSVLNKIGAEAEEGKFDESLELLERFEALLKDVQAFLLKAAGEVAEKELAEVDKFLPRLKSALEARDLDQTNTVLTLIQRELAEIGEAIAGDASGLEVKVASVQVDAGQTVVVPLKVERLEQPLGAYSLTVNFDPSIVQLEAVVIRYGSGLTTIDNEAGTVAIQGFEAQNARSGELLLVELTFRAVGASGSETALTLSVDELSDEDGQALSVGEVENGEIEIN